jgi:hypothetical protein
MYLVKRMFIQVFFNATLNFASGLSDSEVQCRKFLCQHRVWFFDIIIGCHVACEVGAYSFFFLIKIYLQES